MCVAIVVPRGARAPARDVLEQCERSNPHGAGLAWVTGGKVHFVKGIEAKDVAHLVAQGIRSPMLIHFRIATAGGPRADLCHPFPIAANAPLEPYGEARAVLIHNGHWGPWEQALHVLAKGKRLPRGPWSDTRAMAYLAGRYGVDFLEIPDERIAVLFADGTIRRHGRWHEREGCFYSNLIWETPMLDRDPFLAAMARADARPGLRAE